MATELFVGLRYALIITLVQTGLLYTIAGVEAGTRAQGTAVCISTLLFLIGGYTLGARLRKRRARLALDTIPTPAQEDDIRGRLLQSLAPLLTVPWAQVFATAAFVSGFGLILLYAGVARPLLGPEAYAEGSGATAAFFTDVIFLPGALVLAIGAMLGVNAESRSAASAVVSCAVFVGLSYAFTTGASYASYDPVIVAFLSLVGVGFAALITGFLLSLALRRLAVVELILFALLVNYGAYLLLALGPVAWTRGANLPDEQIFLALSFAPFIIVAAFSMVGGSLGFILFGGGKFDPGFRYEAQVALRYLNAHRRDGFVGLVTVFAVTGVCLGVMALIIVLSVMSGFEADLKNKILGAHAHIVVGKHGDDFTEYKAVETKIRQQLKGVDTVAAFIQGDAMISTDIGLSGTLVKGVDPTDQEATRELRENIKKGKLEYLLNPEKIPGYASDLEFPPPRGVKSATAAAGKPADFAEPIFRAKPKRAQRTLPGVIVGRELARTLRAYVGDTVKIVSPVSEELGPLGPTPKLRRFRVAGIFYSGMYEYDAKFTYIHIKQAQRLFGMRKRANGVEIKVKDVDDTSRIVEDLAHLLGGEPYTVKDWRYMNKELFSALLLEKLAMFIALAMIVMVASFLIVSTLVMIVLQRGKEIAIIKSLGASDASIMKIFVVQGLIVGVGGAVLGVLGGVAICLGMERFGVRLDERIFYIEKLPVVMDGVEVAAIALAAIIISYLATIYPAMTAAQLPPVQGLRDD